jgi:hypothetical protein
MAENTDKYCVYTLRGLPAGVFGEAYIVVASANVSTGIYRAEHYILTQRPQESLRSGALRINATDLPTDLGVVDADFAIGEGYRQAEIDIFELLEKRAIELNRADVALLPFKLKPCQSPFVGCRMRGRFLQQLADVSGKVKMTHRGR